jgi:biotin synthase
MATQQKIKEYTPPQSVDRWSKEKATQIIEMPFGELLDMAHGIHKKEFNANEVQASTLMNIKTGKCPEDCSYCPQSAHYDTDLKSEPLALVDDVIESAKKAKELGATRFCMGAAWRSPSDKDMTSVIGMIKGVKNLGMEACVTLGMLDNNQAKQLKDAGLDYYNHNIDTSEEFYKEIISTRTFSDRMNTINKVQQNDIKVCVGGIIGMGENQDDRISMLLTLANMKKQPESVPINQLIPIPGTPLANQTKVDTFDFIRIIALARILMPQTFVRLSAGREKMSEEMQFLCFFAGANSIFYGDKLLTSSNKDIESDLVLLKKLGMNLKQKNSK